MKQCSETTTSEDRIFLKYNFANEGLIRAKYCTKATLEQLYQWLTKTDKWSISWVLLHKNVAYVAQ